MAWNCRAGWLPEIEEFLSFLSQLMTIPTRERRPCRQARSLSSGSRSAKRFFCELFKRLCSWPGHNHKAGTMVRADRLSTSTGYSATTFLKENECPRRETLSFGCLVRRAYCLFAGNGLPVPRLLPAACSASSSRAARSIPGRPSHGDPHHSEDLFVADFLPSTKCSTRRRTACPRFDDLEGRRSWLR